MCSVYIRVATSIQILAATVAYVYCYVIKLRICLPWMNAISRNKKTRRIFESMAFN